MLLCITGKTGSGVTTVIKELLKTKPVIKTIDDTNPTDSIITTATKSNSEVYILRATPKIIKALAADHKSRYEFIPVELFADYKIRKQRFEKKQKSNDIDFAYNNIKEQHEFQDIANITIKIDANRQPDKIIDDIIILISPILYRKNKGGIYNV